MRRWPALVLALLCGAAAAQSPAPATPRFGERVEVDVVNVDVLVTDRDGRPVTDLGRDDFELRIDGVPVPIEYFAAPEAEAAVPADPLLAPIAPAVPGSTPAPPPAAPPPPEAGHLFVFVDQSALEWKTSDTIVEEIREFLLARAGRDDRVLVASFADTLRVLSDATGDRAAMLAALAEVDRLRGRGTRVASTRTLLEREVRNFGLSFSVSPERERAFIEAETQRLKHEVEQYGREELDRQRRSIAALEQWIGVLAALDGHKSVLLVTGGYTATPTAFLAALLQQKRGQVLRSGFDGVDLFEAEGNDLMVRFEAMLRAAQNARISFYTITPRTPPVAQNSAEFGSLGRGVARPAPRDLTLIEAASSVARLAEATGGASLFLDAGLSSELERVDRDRAGAYSLGFPVGPEAGDDDHRIEVTVRRPGLEVRHRESFRRLSLAEQADQEVAAGATLGAAAASFPLALELGAPVPESGRGQAHAVAVTVRIPIAGLALLPEGETWVGRLEVRVALRDDQGAVRVAPPTAIDLRIPAAEHAEALAGNWAHRAELRLAPGTHRVAVTVTDLVAGLYSTATATVVVPAEPSDRK